MSGNQNLGNIKNSRTAEQTAHMQKTVGQGRCPFCDGNGFDPEKNKVVLAGTFWRAWLNPFPYPHHLYHVVLAPFKHITTVTEIGDDMWLEWAHFNDQLIKKYNLPGGGIVMRFGENEYNAGTLSHVHSHIQVPDLTGPAFSLFCKSPLDLKDEGALKSQEHMALLRGAFGTTVVKP